jgi:excinuclease ABC subunit C
MKGAADVLDFERAAVLRDVLAGLASIEQRQRALDIRERDLDVLGIARDGDIACAVLLRIRAGKLLGREVDFFANVGDEPDATLLGTAATRAYFGRGDAGLADLPREVLFPADFEDRELVGSMLTERAGRNVEAHVPQRGDKVRLIELANQNARHLLEERTVLASDATTRADDFLYDVQEALDMKVVPRLAVCFDISHTQGDEVVGSAIVFRNGEPDKSEYRKYRIRGEWGNDDFASMAEVVGRYFRRRIAEQRPLPDLALIDGGRGQLAAAVRAAEQCGATDVTFASLAKREEDVYTPGRAEPLRLSRTRRALRMLQRMRDEAHRFAHGFNRKRRQRKTLDSELSEIRGIGPARRKALLRHFGSVRALRAASPADIAVVPGVTPGLAQTVADHLRGDGA